MPRRRRSRASLLPVLATAVALAGAGCAPQSDGEEPTASERSDAVEGDLRLTSPDFDDGGPIPEAFTCAEDGRVPTLEWTGLPEGAGSLALTVLDPDAPGGTFAHWVLYDLDPNLTGFPQGRYPADATQAVNSAGTQGWFPPCPPRGDGPHRYQFTLWVLEADVGRAIEAGAWEAVLAELEQEATVRTSITGTVDLD